MCHVSKTPHGLCLEVMGFKASLPWTLLIQSLTGSQGLKSFALSPQPPILPRVTLGFSLCFSRPHQWLQEGWGNSGCTDPQVLRPGEPSPGSGLARCLLSDSVASVVEEAMTSLCCWCAEHARKFVPAAKLSPCPSSHTDLRLWAGSSWNCIRTSEALGMLPALKF